MDQYVRIEKAANGYRITARDPEIMARNSKTNNNWQDPDVEYVFTTPAEMKAFLDKNLDTLLEPAEDAYAVAFKKAVKL